MLAPAGAMGGDRIPPENPGNGPRAATPAGSPAVSFCVLRKRTDFLKCASARRQGTDGFLLQARDRGDGDSTVRVGFTASKKIGNAVTRNRAKRRLRALAREVLADLARPGWDYVLVARPEATVTRAYADLCADLRRALRSVHRA
ncbi:MULTISPECIES: ribonuclease P protein component [Tabrizicola]|uniref:ribonuclease P protein component n=1 Tax=Tabrizicola TaxID=1443919 RepID=UPI001F117103|nr:MULTISPECIES: ribonuclease P protein component [Paracoccaceae]